MQSKSKSRCKPRCVVVFTLLATCLLLMHQLRAADLFITDGDSIYKFDGTTLTPNFVGPLSDVFAGSFGGTVIGPDGNLYVASDDDSEIFRVNPTTGAQIGAGPFVNFEGAVQNPPGPDPHDVIIPQGMKFGPDGNLYVADGGGNQTIHVYDQAGNSVTNLGLHDPNLLAPRGVAFDSQNNLWVANQSGGIAKFNPGTSNFDAIDPNHLNGLGDPFDLAFSPLDAKLYVVDEQNDQILRFTSSGDPDGTFTTFNGIFFIPAGMAFDSSGDLFVSGLNLDAGDDGEVLEFDPNGDLLGTPVTGLSNPSFLTFAPEPTCLAGLCLGMLLMHRRRTV
jgi:DNA-binding beta-propeller fold protein YncE